MTQSNLIEEYVFIESDVKTDHHDEVRLVSQQLIVLGDPCKTILQLYYYKDMRMNDIAHIMGYKNARVMKIGS